MRIPVEVFYDEQTRQWCVGMVSPPWVASCAASRLQAKRKFAEAFRAYFEGAGRAKPKDPGRRGRVELISVA